MIKVINSKNYYVFSDMKKLKKEASKYDIFGIKDQIIKKLKKQEGIIVVNKSEFDNFLTKIRKVG
jgi:hypothetical protein